MSLLNTGIFQYIYLFQELNTCLLNTGCLPNRSGHSDRFYCIYLTALRAKYLSKLKYWIYLFQLVVQFLYSKQPKIVKDFKLF